MALSALLMAVFFNAKTMKAAQDSAQTPHVRMQVKAAGTKPSFDEGTQPTVVTLKDGMLTVNAHDSDLDQILKEVVRLGGMTMTGTIRKTQIFGTYGPGNPRDVLTSLLTGSGYNFMMVGNTHDGVPRELLLTVENGNPSSAAAHNVPAGSSSVDQENADAATTDEDPPGPGAIIHVPPAGPEDPQERAQQNLQRLTHMRQQQTTQPQ
jgi:hypothetical protein